MAHSSLRTTHCSLLTTCSVVLEVDTSLQDLLHLHGRPLIAAPRGADSAGLNQYRKVRRQQREASFLSNVDLGEHDAEQSGNLRDPNPSPSRTLGLSLSLILGLSLGLTLTLPRQPACARRRADEYPRRARARDPGAARLGG